MLLIIEKLQDNIFFCGFIFLFIAFYFFKICKSFFELLKLNSCINALYNFVCSATLSNGRPVDKKSDYNKNLNNVLRKYPDIAEFASFNAPSLSYSDHADVIYRNSVTLYNELLMKRNFAFKNLKQCFNPVESIKTIICLPSSAIKLIGFEPKGAVSKLLNLLGWILAYLLNIYGNEIKTLINSFLLAHLHTNI